MEVMEESVEDSVKIKKFLTDFATKNPEPLPDQDALPFRLITYYLTEEEVEGECLDWAMQYLRVKECPEGLAEMVARQAVDAIMKTDLSLYHAPETPSLEDGAIFGDESTDSPEPPPEQEAPRAPRLEASRLARAVFGQVHEVCKQLKDQPPTVPKPSICYCAHAIKNTRRKMEDKHVIQHHLNTLYGLKEEPSHYYFAVFDGHGGVEAAHYAGIHLHNNMMHSAAFKENPLQALADAFIKTDKDFVEKSKRESLKCGTTGVSILLRENMAYLAWLGDSQALLVRDGQPVQLMEPHKPEREDEKKRIEDLGGCVVWFGAWRVNGSLSVSRAIGDADHKPYVSGVPDVKAIPLDGTEDYIVLACDGLWDTVDPQDVVHTVHEAITDENGDKSTVAHRLVFLARDNASTDNITVIVIFLRDKIAEPKPINVFNFEGSESKSESKGSGDQCGHANGGHGNKGEQSPPSPASANGEEKGSNMDNSHSQSKAVEDREGDVFNSQGKTVEEKGAEMFNSQGKTMEEKGGEMFNSQSSTDSGVVDLSQDSQASQAESCSI